MEKVFIWHRYKSTLSNKILMNSDQSVKSFYQSLGWSAEVGQHEPDAEMFEDLRTCSSKYLIANRIRLSQYFQSSGIAMLDCASGPIQYKEYVSYSNDFDKRYCVDLSEEALKKAKAKLPNKVIPICGDIREINFCSLKFDVIISLHTIYHIEIDDQLNVIRKLKECLSTNGTLVIVYSNPSFLFEKLKNVAACLVRKKSNNNAFYFKRLRPSIFKKVFPEASFRAYRMFSGEDMRRCFPNCYLTTIFLVFVSYVEPFLPLFMCQYYIIKFNNNLP